MLRIQRFIASLVVFLSVWAALVSEKLKLDFVGPREMLVIKPVRRG